MESKRTSVRHFSKAPINVVEEIAHPGELLVILKVPAILSWSLWGDEGVEKWAGVG